MKEEFSLWCGSEPLAFDAGSQFLKIAINRVNVDQVAFLEQARHAAFSLKFSGGNPVEHSDDGDTAAPGSTNFQPNPRTFKRPRGYQNQQFRRFIHGVTDNLLKVRSDPNLCFVEKRLRPDTQALMRNLPGHPRIDAAMADKY